MARTRGGKRLNSKTPLAAQESTSHTETASPANHKSKYPYVCPTCSKGYVLRASFLAHTLLHTKEKLRNVKPKRQHHREPRQTSSLSLTTIPAAWEAEMGRSLDSQTSSLSPTRVPSTWEAELGRSLEGQTSSLSPTSVPSAREAELGRSLEGQTYNLSPTSVPSVWKTELWRSLEVPTSMLSPNTIPSTSQSSSPFPSPTATSTAATLEHEWEFGTTSSSLSSTPSTPKSVTKRSKDSTCVADGMIPDPSGPKTLKKHASNTQHNNEGESTMIVADPSSPKMMKKHTSNTQDNSEAESTMIIPDPSSFSPKAMKKHASIIEDTNNEAEPTIIISDDEENSVPHITPETDGNYTRIVSPTLSTSELDVTSFKIVENEQEYSDSAMYTTPAKAPNFSYEDSGTSENVSHSFTLPKAKMNHFYPGDITLISSDDDEPVAPVKTGSSKKKNVAKRLFSNLPLRQNQLRNGGFGSQDFKSRETESKANPTDNSRGDVKEALDKINRLGPVITVTKAKTTNISNKNSKEAMDKIRKLGPAISFTRLNK